MQTHLKQPPKIAIFVDEEILDELAIWCQSEIQCHEDDVDDFSDYTPREQLEAKFWFMHKYEIMKRLAKAVNPILKELCKEEVKYL